MLRDRLALHLAAGAIAAVILAPLAWPGYVLSYDMSFVPSQSLRLDLIAPLDAAPRAVPLDAAVSLINLAMPGWLLQRLILVAIVWAAVVGAGRLVPTESLGVRLIAAIGYGWTPFLAERLLLGQWGLLIAYAALPWLVRAALDLRAEKPGAWPKLVLLLGLSALTPSGGIIAAAVCLALAPLRKVPLIGGAVLLVNSPWLVAALVGNSTAHSDPAGVAAFAARSENWGGAIVSLLGTGGIWNEETTPASRASPLVPILTAVVVLLSLFGYQKMRHRMPSRFPAVAVTGLAIAALSTFGPGITALTWLVDNVPGAGVLRDAQKFVLPYALLLVLCAALGAERLASRLPKEPAAVVLTGTVLLMMCAVPDLAFGGAGALRPVRYPPDWQAVSELVGREPGVALSLPLSEYRRYRWNRNRTVFDPALRYLPVPVLADDTLVVDDVLVAGENVRLREIRARLASGEPIATADVRWVLIQHRGVVDQAVPPGALTGLESVFIGPDLALYRNPAAVASTVEPARHAPIVAAEIAALLAMIAAAGTIAGTARR
ncbi:hypothetical protein Rhe02_43410 [Rhizocola hellebori]|uniref:Uncharacterized protein n=1 Tax=Rhizocola hellebori TaxID=1392758 RepID=A0A8J3QA75_9ACTN|nr:hypothetical protein [Rhizocola hellebori]GIH06274.1 hypothetical protein Rhe02_43410 [Rhizocola hellebori]